MALDIEELYKELGLITYNLEFHKALVEQLEQEKNSLLSKIQDIQTESNSEDSKK